MSEPKVDLELALDHGLDQQEYQRVVDALGRAPSYTELGIVSVMWSEHCSYKSSRVHLKTLPTEGDHVIEGPGENAGVVDIGDGLAAVFKMESHNHPSFIEPYQGAATGVGGICRDVFTMGARPVAIADYLRFGEPGAQRTPYLVAGVVAGIAGYGNSFGVPTVAGDVAFDASYNGNNLVNAFCLGIARSDRIFRGTASGVGNPVIYVGAKTGRDGIHGATMASAEFGEDAEAKRPAVQVGDPFMEKLLLEACLELMETDCLVGIQDMGAAGLTSSAVEMAARAGSGIELELDAVPMREQGMTAYEVMLSESQERMLMVVESGRENEAMAIFQKWDLDAAIIGRVTDTGRVVVKMNDEIRADLPSELLADGAVYDRPRQRPSYLDRVRSLSVDDVEDVGSPSEILLDLLGDPNIASKRWVYEQYDYNVRHGTVRRPGQADAGVVRVNAHGKKGLAIAGGCNSRWVYLDPYHGTRGVVAEAYANLVAAGATPLAVTNCLNFGNPEKPEIMWQFAESVRGLGDACKLLGTPVVSGNVSLYNETDGEPIRPTPMVAMVGLLDDVADSVPMAFAGAGDVIAIVGAPAGRLDGSEYLARFRGRTLGSIDVLTEDHRDIFAAIAALTSRRLLRSCHDISEGGLALAIAESAVGSGIGALCKVSGSGRSDEFFFGEGLARFVISYSQAHAEEVATLCDGVRFQVVGSTGGDVVAIEAGDSHLAVSVKQAADRYAHGFQEALALE